MIFQDLDQLARIRALEDNALDVVEDYFYERELSEEEMEELRTSFADKHMEIEALEKKKAEFMAKFKAEMRQAKEKAMASLKMIRTGREEVTGTAYFLQDFEDAKIKIFNADGLLIGDKPMKQADRQRRLFTGTND